MEDIATNYFVCTLGEAAHESIDRPYRGVSDLIAHQARAVPNHPAIGFYQNAKNAEEAPYTVKLFTFGEVAVAVDHAATAIQQTLLGVKVLEENATVALLMHSSPTFLFTWLGLIRMGHPVLLLAPQLSGSAAAHLCKTCNVTVLVVDEGHASAGDAIATAWNEQHDGTSGAPELRILMRPSVDIDRLLMSTESEALLPNPSYHGVAYLHHTSGTSSGLPKSIPQTHAGAIAVLPRLDGKEDATFTTTPLYHGGPADIFRAWSSGALIWLFPSQDVPIATKNIIKCLEASNSAASNGRVPTVKYFASVPYVLQMMAEDHAGLKWLEKMSLVGVGGAALPAQVGHELVEKGINLVSRFGSAECGFLLSSHREYEADKEWEYLRLSDKTTGIDFECRDEDLFELVVKPHWPHMAKRNRDDGSFATSDVFKKHPTIANAWQYHSRADSQIALVTGKKFDPSSLEHDLVAALEGVSDVLVFGQGQAYPGALVFRNDKAVDLSDTDLLDQEKISNVITKHPKHAQIPNHMLVAMPYMDKPLEKSSKGTILRTRAEERYQNRISMAYQQANELDAISVPDSGVTDFVTSVIQEVSGMNLTDKLDPDADIFSLGIDSIASIRIRQRLLALLSNATASLPLTVVQQCGTVTTIAQRIIDMRHGRQSKAPIDSLNIQSLIESFSSQDDARPVEYMTDGFTTIVEPPGKTVLLTGATGSLGSHVLSGLCQDSSILRIYVLVRGATPKAAHERVKKALSSRKLPIPEYFSHKVTILQCKLSDPDLGVPFMDYSTLQSDVDIVLHLAWSVNFLLPLRSFQPHFAGIQNLLSLCSSSTKRKLPRFVFCSSVAAVSNHPPCDGGVEESIVPAFSACGSTGYAESKLTAELLLARVATTYPAFRDRITIIRVGQLSADTKYGIWNASEAYPQILATSSLTDGLLPDLGEEELLTWLPVDVASKAFIEASLSEPSTIGKFPTEHVKHRIGEWERSRVAVQGHGGRKIEELEIDTSAVKVLHLVNPEIGFTFTDFITRVCEIVNKDPASPSLRVGAASEWLSKLDQLASDKDSSAETSTSTRLLPFWKQAYYTRGPLSDKSSRTVNGSVWHEGQQGSQVNLYTMHNSLITMPTLATWLGLSTVEGQATLHGKQALEDASKFSELLTYDYVKKIWNWVQGEMQIH